MKIDTFLAERWMDIHAPQAAHSLNDTCPGVLSLDGLIELCGLDRAAVLGELAQMPLGYGHTRGLPRLLRGLSALYQQVTDAQIMTTHGTTGANHLAFWALVEPGDRVIALAPAYQQNIGLPKGFLAEMTTLALTPERGWLPDLDLLADAAQKGVKLICLNNPNNPTGALIPPDMLADIADIAARAGAYVLCDEAYWQLNQADGPAPAMADLYERGISVSSLSKASSMPGLRLGWIACRDEAVMSACLARRDYNTITCGGLDEAIAALAIEGRGRIMARNRAHLQRNLAVLTDWMATQPRLSWVRPQAGSVALIHYDLDQPSERFCLDVLEKAGVHMLPGFCFGVPHSFRVGYAGPTPALEAALDALGRYLAGL